MLFSLWKLDMNDSLMYSPHRETHRRAKTKTRPNWDFTKHPECPQPSSTIHHSAASALPVTQQRLAGVLPVRTIAVQSSPHLGYPLNHGMLLVNVSTYTWNCKPTYGYMIIMIWVEQDSQQDPGSLVNSWIFIPHGPHGATTDSRHIASTLWFKISKLPSWIAWTCLLGKGLSWHLTMFMLQHVAYKYCKTI